MPKKAPKNPIFPCSGCQWGDTKVLSHHRAQMGTIRTREKANGEKSYTAIVRVKSRQIIVHNETQTFPKKALAQAWVKRREAELQQQKATGVVNLSRVTIAEILEAYVTQAEGVTDWGRAKTADIKRLRESGLSNKDARYLTAADIIEYAKHRRTVDEAGPATVMNDIIWLRQAFLTGVALFNLSQPLLAVGAAKKTCCARRRSQNLIRGPGAYRRMKKARSWRITSDAPERNCRWSI